MSAYVVTKQHIDALVTVAVNGPSGVPVAPSNAWQFPVYLDSNSPAELGQILWDANVASVNARYGENDTAARYTYEPGRRLTVVEALKALDGYEYQTCEVPNWYGSDAFAVVQRLRRYLITRLNGYNDADTWSL